MFECPHNWALLTPATMQLAEHLNDAITCTVGPLTSIIEQSQAFLQCFANVMYLTAGIPPYAQQTVQLRYATDSTTLQNF